MNVIAGIDKLTELADTLNGDSDTAKQLTKYADEYTYTGHCLFLNDSVNCK